MRTVGLPSLHKTEGSDSYADFGMEYWFVFRTKRQPLYLLDGQLVPVTPTTEPLTGCFIDSTSTSSRANSSLPGASLDSNPGWNRFEVLFKVVSLVEGRQRGRVQSFPITPALYKLSLEISKIPMDLHAFNPKNRTAAVLLLVWTDPFAPSVFPSTTAWLGRITRQ